MNNWQQQKLGDIADVKLSNVDKKVNLNERTVRLCNYTDVYKNAFINSTIAKKFMVATCNENEFEKFILRKGQVAITKDSETRDDIGIPTYISENFEDVVLGYHLSLITPNENKLNGRFLYYWLNTKQGRRYFENNAGGSGQRCTLPLEIIKSMPLNLPDLPIQEKIASILSNLDAKIELNSRINTELEAMAKTVYDYWFVQFDFPNADGKPYRTEGGKMVWSEALKREIPEGWEMKRLGSILLCNYKTIKKGEGYENINYLDTSNLTNNLIENVQKINLKTENLPSRAQRIIQTNDILYSTVRPNQCHFGIIKNPIENMIASTGFAQLTSKLSTIKNEFVYMYLSSEFAINRLDQIASSSVSAYPSISPTDILNLPIAIPKDHNIIESICEVLEPIYSKIAINQKETQHLTQLRDWLLPMLMNGQVLVE